MRSLAFVIPAEPLPGNDGSHDPDFRRCRMALQPSPPPVPSSGSSGEFLGAWATVSL